LEKIPHPGGMNDVETIATIEKSLRDSKPNGRCEIDGEQGERRSAFNSGKLHQPEKIICPSDFDFSSCDFFIAFALSRGAESISRARFTSE
jgi:hypothetical protein